MEIFLHFSYIVTVVANLAFMDDSYMAGAIKVLSGLDLQKGPVAS